MNQNMAFVFQESARRYAKQPAFASRHGREFLAVTYEELFEDALALAEALCGIGLAARDHAGLFCDNRKEWILSSMAVTLCGAADVPRATDVTDQDLTYIVPHSDMRILFVENQDLLSRLLKNKTACAGLGHIIVVDGRASVTPEEKQAARVHTLASLLDTGRRMRASGSRLAEERMKAIRPEDLYTLIYTSGTTGAPKGVMLTHGNMISQIERVPIEIRAEDRILSILPVWHIFERVFELIAIASGCCTYYSSIRTLREDFSLVKPTFMASAPRLWENIYQGITANVQKAPAVSRRLFGAAVRAAGAFRGSLKVLSGRELERPASVAGRAISWILALIKIPLLALPFLVLDTIVLRKIRRATGGQLRGSCSGGGALPYHVDHFFNSIGIPVLEGYGMTETSPVIAVRTFDNLVVGTVGPLYRDTDLRLVDLASGEILYSTEDNRPRRTGVKGEIHVRGPQVMKGYYKNPEATARVLREGWMNTGDLGIMTWNGCLKIVGRSKETIVLLGGENVEPVPIENRIQESVLVQACMVVGQDQKYLAALVVPAAEHFDGAPLSELSRSSEAHARVRSEIKRLVNAEAGFKSFERVVDVRLLPQAFSVGDELTAKLSVKRHVVQEKYADLIQDIYRE
jgi:long-chain acyl-CoA synthetase